MAIIDKVRTALRITTEAYNDELADLIEASKIDLGIAGVIVPSSLDEIVERAIVTYCKMNFGLIEATDYDRLKASYDEQKSQLATCSEYTDWLD